MSEIAADLGRAMGKDVEYRAQSMVDFEADFGTTRAEFYNLTGHKPTSYYDYLTTKGSVAKPALKSYGKATFGKKAPMP